MLVLAMNIVIIRFLSTISPASLGPMYNEVPGVGRKNVGPATVVSIAQDSTNEIVLTQMLVNGIHSLCCVIVCADGERRRSCMSFTCDSMSEISGDTMTTLELHNGWRLFKSKHSGVSS